MSGQNASRMAQDGGKTGDSSGGRRSWPPQYLTGREAHGRLRRVSAWLFFCVCKARVFRGAGNADMGKRRNFCTHTLHAAGLCTRHGASRPARPYPPLPSKLKRARTHTGGIPGVDSVDGQKIQGGVMFFITVDFSELQKKALTVMCPCIHNIKKQKRHYSYYSYYRMAVSDYWHTYFLRLLEKLGENWGKPKNTILLKKSPRCTKWLYIWSILHRKSSRLALFDIIKRL